MAETETFQAAAFTARGTQRDAVTLPGATFDGVVNVPVMHQAVKAFLANQRQGNAQTKNRKVVVGGNKKPWKQKGTGRARQGSTRAPQWVGGGTVFGPVPRSYAQYVPRQVRALARKSAFNARAREGAVYVVDAFDYAEPKTGQVVALLDRMGLEGRKVLILTNGLNTNLYLSTRNLPSVEALPYSDVSTYHILWSDVVLIESGALGETLAPVAEEDPAAARPRRSAATSRAPKPRAAAGTERDARSSRPAAKKGARKTAKKAAAKAASGKAKGRTTGTAKKTPAAKKKKRT